MYEVIGIERLNYTNKSNKHVQGYRVYFVWDPREGQTDVQGKLCDAVYINDALFAESGIAVGSPAMPIYDKWGRCAGFMESPL